MDFLGVFWGFFFIYPGHQNEIHKERKKEKNGKSHIHSNLRGVCKIWLKKDKIKKKKRKIKKKAKHGAGDI